MRRILLLLFSFASAALADTARDRIGVISLGFPEGGCWFPATQIWCVGAGGPFLAFGTDCTPDSITPADDLNAHADLALSLGIKTFACMVHSNLRSFYKFNNPPYSTTDFSHMPQDRLSAMVQRLPYTELFKKGFTTFELGVFPAVPLCEANFCDPNTHPETCRIVDCKLPLDSSTQEFNWLFGLLSLSDVSKSSTWPEPYAAAPVIDGMTEDEKSYERLAIKNLVTTLLFNPDLHNKTVIISSGELDWLLRADHQDDGWEPCDPQYIGTDPPCDATPPTRQTRVNAVRAWLGARQAGVTEARQENPAKWHCPPTSTQVCILNTAEVNKVQWSMEPDHRMTALDDVLPYVPGCCDVYGYHFWDTIGPQTARTLIERFNYIQDRIPPARPFGLDHSNILLAEYGIMGADSAREITQAAIAFGCPYTSWWQLVDDEFAAGLPPPCTSPPCLLPRATNADTNGLGLIRPDGSHTATANYFQAANLLRVGLRTYNGYYVSADSAGGGAVHVNAPWLREWEWLTIGDINGGTLVSGDKVNILTKNANFLMAQNAGGGTVDATSEHALSWEEFTILKQNGTGTIGPGDTVAFQSGDGHYFVPSGSGLLATSNSIGPWEKFALSAIPIQRIRADLTGDATSDIWWRNTSTGDNTLWNVDGNGLLATATPPSMNVGFTLVGVGDFNHDGAADCLWRNLTTGELVIWLMSGGVRTGTLSLPTVTPAWAVVGVGDFNGDGYADILWRLQQTGENSVWYITANGWTGGGTSLPTITDQNLKIISITDFDGDGNADILWRNMATGDVYTWVLDIHGGIRSGYWLGAIPLSVTLVGTGDFNADGNFDLVWRSTVNGETSVWFLHGGAFEGGGFNFGNVPLNGVNIVGVGDFNGDGYYDLLWRNEATGENSIWFITANGFIGGATLPNVAGSASKIVAPFSG